MMNPPTGKIHNRAFTLIELLAVVAILGLLIALSVPVLGKMRMSAQRSESASNLLTLGAALMLYASENNSAFPPVASTVKGEDGNWSSGNPGSWDGYILPYLFLGTYFNIGNPPSYYNTIRGSASLFSHPNDRSEITTAVNVRRGYAMPHGAGMIGVTTWTGSEIRPSARQAVISRPSQTILLVENPGIKDNTVGRTGISGINSAQGQMAKQPDLNGKLGEFHYLFADGHVELLAVEKTIGKGSLTLPKGMWTLDPND